MDYPKRYPEAMRHFHSLFAVWSPDQTDRLKPGVCGYFDDSGDWNVIANLCDAKANGETFPAPPAVPKPVDKSQGSWPPVCSEGVTWMQAALDAPIPIPNLGAKFEAKMEFTKQKKYGACLITGPEVSSTYVENPKKVFEDWAKAHYASIREQFEDLGDHDLWIITKTYHTPRCAISSWSGLQQSASLYVGAGALVGNALTIDGAVGEAQQSGMWRFFPGESDDQKKVASRYTVFVGGLRYRSGIFGPREVRLTAPMRGSEEEHENFVVDTSEGKLQVTCEEWGIEGDF